MNKQIKYKKVVEWSNTDMLFIYVLGNFFAWGVYAVSLGTNWQGVLFLDVGFLLFMICLWEICMPKRKVYWVREK